MNSVALFRRFRADDIDLPVAPRDAGGSAAHGTTRTAAAQISATILTKDAGPRLHDALAALRWCEQVIVLDTGSTDHTTVIAAQYPNVCVHRLAGPFPGFGRAHQEAVRLARNDWILSIDSDEIVSPELAREIAESELDVNAVYTIPFHNHFNGRHITSCGWFPDRHKRLFNRKTTNFCDSEIHEKVLARRHQVRALRGAIHHYSYESMDDFLRKMRAYGLLFASQHAGRRPSGPWKAVLHSVWAFVKSYLLQRGFLQGYEGLVISTYKSHTVFWKYLFLHEANQRRA